MIKPELIVAGNFAAIMELTKQAVSGMLGFDLLRIGVNAVSEEGLAT
ncbi:MAG TPA: hypothetical protein VN445_13705 [Rectinemataceae bacterium]|nr:hypothetical protein [Rectinemataceae bacterium]